jgi:hypothetical protein
MLNIACRCLSNQKTHNIEVTANDVSDEDFWERYSPMATLQSPLPSLTLERDTTFRRSPNAGDFLLWVRCANSLCNPPEFVVVDFWEFREGDSLLITNREEDYPVPLEDMEEGGPSLWKVLPGDRIAWSGWRAEDEASKPTLIS